MSLKEIEIHNFKTFDSLILDLRQFNILIGANASGKSNFIEVFKFIRDISRYGLENAVSMQGGMEYIRNIKSKIEEDTTITLTIVFDDNTFSIRSQKDYSVSINPVKVRYSFSLRAKEKIDDFIELVSSYISK